MLCFFLMAGFQKIGSTSELPPEGEAREFPCGARTICVANVNGAYGAIDNVCPHRGGPLGQGVVHEGQVVCPWHGWQFDPLTGRSGQSTVAVDSYDLRIEGEEVFARLRER